MAKDELIELSEYARRAYLEYAMAVVTDRAIPFIQDGQKPVQRRLLYAMKKLGLGASSDPSKSARVVGEVLGKYHPHGDGATYEAMVRMAQNFSLRYPLIDGVGNYGSRDGDKAAAYRYTETRLAPLAETLLSELTWDTVDMIPNFDGKEKEPKVLPSRLPTLFLNGASGIAVGMATEFPSHNIKQVVEAAKLLIRKPQSTFDEVFDIIQGPDYPTGGVLISSSDEIKAAYQSGRGSVRLRSRWKVEPEEKGWWKLVFYEVPQGTNCEKLMEAIDGLMDPKPKESKDGKGKKTALTPEQLRVKKLFGELVKNYENGSDKEYPVRIVITPQDKKMDPEALALMLCAHTDLEMNMPVNMVALDIKGSPKVQGIDKWLAEWCEFRIETVRRRTVDQKRQIDARLHILLGRLSIMDKIQEVVKMLTTSENPKEDLMSLYNLDEIQADDILDMKLRSLARLEKYKIQDEHNKKSIEQKYLGGLLADEKLLKKVIIQELDADTKIFADERKTLLDPQESTNSKKVATTSIAEKIAPEPVALALTERGWLAWRPAKSLEEALTLDYKIKAGDEIRHIYFGDRNDNFVMMSETGRAYSLHLLKLPSKADAAPLNSWFDLDKRIVEGAITSENQEFIVCGTEGSGYIVKASEWINRMNAGKQFLKLKENELPLTPIALPKEGVREGDLVVALATDGRAVAFDAKELPKMAKGKGNALMGFAKGHSLQDAYYLSQDEVITLKTGKQTFTITPELIRNEFTGPRSSSKKGKALHKKSIGAIFIRAGRENQTKEI